MQAGWTPSEWWDSKNIKEQCVECRGCLAPCALVGKFGWVKGFCWDNWAQFLEGIDFKAVKQSHIKGISWDVDADNGCCWPEVGLDIVKTQYLERWSRGPPFQRFKFRARKNLRQLGVPSPNFSRICQICIAWILGRVWNLSPLTTSSTDPGVEMWYPLGVQVPLFRSHVYLCHVRGFGTLRRVQLDLDALTRRENSWKLLRDMKS